MIDKERLILMTKIALHEKKYNKKDKRINEYFRNDYIYRKNATNRFFIFIGLCFLFIFVVLDMIYIKQIDFFNFDYKNFGIKVAIVLIGIFIFYTAVGILKYGLEYDLAQKRYKKYFTMLNSLDEQINQKNLEDNNGGLNERDFSN